MHNSLPPLWDEIKVFYITNSLFLGLWVDANAFEYFCILNSHLGQLLVSQALTVDVVASLDDFLWRVVVLQSCISIALSRR